MRLFLEKITPLKSLVVVMVCLVLVACGNEDDESNNNNNTNTPSSSAPDNTTGNPSNPSEPDPINPALLRPAGNNESAQFLMRTTFGPRQAEITALVDQPYEAWIDEQMQLEPSYQLPRLEAVLESFGYQNINNNDQATHRRALRSDIWFDTVINGNDQLRQRVAFALSQIFVISELDMTGRVRGIASYNDVLVRHSFGNFRDLLEEVTLHPMMGDFLSMRRNEKANASGTIQPDENYAREVMQLFTIGLTQLNIDGTEVLDESGQPIPTYGQTEVRGFAKVFTGWNYGDAPRLRSNARTLQSEVIPMVAFEDFHDTSSKQLLNGALLPPDQTANQDLQMALDNLFNHSNVGPFIAEQLIQRLVTSNPSPEYVARVARTFNDNGDGQRGDLAAVIKQILLDEEALLGSQIDPEGFGKVKEPLLRLTHFWRAFDARGEAGRLRYTLGLGELGQKHLSAPSVFNFFSPTYSQPGILDDLDLSSPELQIINESTAVTSVNRFRSYINEFNNGGTSERGSLNRIFLNFADELALADSPSALIDHFNQWLFAGQMSQSTHAALVELVEQTPFVDDGTLRVREALLLAILSPDFAYQR